MNKVFNYTGTCVPGKHFMVDTGAKLERIMQFIERGEYFSINRPRQYGKSTTMNLLERELEKKGFLPILISFEGIGDVVFQSESSFCEAFLDILADSLSYDYDEYAQLLTAEKRNVVNFKELSQLINRFIKTTGKDVVLMIDEVDKSSNNQLFVSFIAMLRDRYLLRNRGKGATFKTVILAGVHDVKSLKLKVRPGDEERYNSPWNIAVDFTVDLAFTSKEIETMLHSYCEERSLDMDIPLLAKSLYNFTSGYPFLVSRLCYIIDTYLLEQPRAWTCSDIDWSVNYILREENTNFDSLIKNLENNRELYRLVEQILLKGRELEYNGDSRLVKLGTTYGVFKSGDRLKIHNRIYRERIYNYMALNLKIERLLDNRIDEYSYAGQFILPGMKLDFEKILLRFQAFMKEQYSRKDDRFVEYNWRLLYLAFIKPIINGHGFDFKEAQISEEKRLDVVITYYNSRYISELKIWEGQKRHEAGLKQLADYLERQAVDTGYLVIFDFRKEMDYKSEWVNIDGKRVFTVWV